MLRFKTKTKVEAILKLLAQIQQKILLRDESVPVELLEDCQRAVISIGECLERELSDRKDLIKEFENYCEQIFALSQQTEQKISIVGKMDALLSRVSEMLSMIKGSYQVVFMPYKAEMWDSLESVWMEFVKDERCETLVIPLPYSTFDKIKQTWDLCYEGNRFPDYVSITDYRQYHLELENPDVIFIHNPYDNYNRVTRIDEAYFSNELKKLTQNLVYIPYYTTTGSISFGHRELSVYYNMDYMIAQSERAKECFKGFPYYHKMLPFGSPKFDKVIRKCQEGIAVLPEWERVLKGRPCLMLNTTISELLTDGKLLLLKYYFFFKLIKNDKRVVIIWRPHPLLESTIQAMRPELLELYYEVIEDFKQNELGVIDNSPDMTDTIAIADGYVGSAWSSVVNSFGVSGKPMFFFNSLIVSETDECRRRLISACAATVEGNKVWLLSGIFNGLLSIDLDQEKKSVRLEKIICEEPRWMHSHMAIDASAGKVYMAAYWAKQHVEYCIKTDKYRLVKKPLGRENEEYFKILVGEHKVILFPARKLEIVFFDKRTGMWENEKQALLAMWEDREYNAVMFGCRDAVLTGNSMWVVSEHTNRILQYDLVSSKYLIYQIGDIAEGFSSVAADGEEIWLADAGKGFVYKYNFQNGDIDSFPFSEEYQVKKDVYGFKVAQLKLLVMKNWVVSIPYRSNLAFRVNKRSGQADILAFDFWNDLDAFYRGYDPSRTPVCSVAVKLDDEKILIQRNTDLAMAIIYVEQNLYEIFYPKLDENSYDRLLDGQDGFDKTSLEALFCCWESNLFPLEDFISNFADGKYAGIKERQLNVLQDLAANLDGTCGKKVHDYLMEKVSG